MISAAQGIMEFATRVVTTDHIDFKDDTFRISTELDTLSLAQSIQNVGLVNLPIAAPKNSHQLRIISGFRRLEACQRLSMASIAVRLVHPSISMIHCAKLAISENTLQRPLNLIEQSRAYRLLASLASEPGQLPKLAAEAGLPDNPTIIAKVKDLSRLSETIQRGILSAKISLSVARELAELSAQAADFLAELFQALGLGFSKQREVLNFIREIAERDDLSQWQVLQSEDLMRIVSAADLDKNQKAHQIRVCLENRRFPEIAKFKKEFSQNIQSLKLGSQVKFTPPVNFEDSNFSLCLNFKTLKELQSHYGVLDRLSQDPYLKKLLD
jgi:ParB family transcriptional regulator, chromosome partitioning protein